MYIRIVRTYKVLLTAGINLKRAFVQCGSGWKGQLLLVFGSRDGKSQEIDNKVVLEGNKFQLGCFVCDI